ncbi:MAG: DHA2 family efflux MFS transporter permease subunit [Gemmatimonadota bacterium]|jgi:DHA2 family multidrug resistance protein
MSNGSGGTHKWVVAGTVLTGTIMAVLDASIINVALPSMRGTLGATVEEITWVVTGYILAQVIVMPITGMLAQRFGRRNLFLFSLLTFTVASMLCGLARSLPLMVFFRVLQGFGGGVIVTAAQAILRETFPPEEQGMAMGIYGMGVVVAPAVGPTLGGWITDNYTWPWVFYVNVPVGILSAFLVTRFIRDPHYLVRDKGRIDWTGLALLAIGLGALQLMLEQGDRNDWFTSSFITTLAVISGVGLVMFVVQELHTKRPSVNLRILKDRAFTTATSIGGVLGAGLFGGLFLLPLFLQNLLGYSAMWSGVVLVPRSAAMAVIMPLGGRMYNRLGPRVLAFTGLAVSAYSFWELSHLTMDIGFWDIFWPQLWQGVGFGLLFVSLSTAALSNIPPPQMTQAAGLYNVVRQVFGSVGIALSATTLTRSMSGFHARLSEHVTAFDGPTQQFIRGATAGMIQRGVDPFTARLRALKLIDLTVLQQAAVLAYNHVFLLVTILFLFTLPLALLLRTRRLDRQSRSGPGVVAD